MDPKITGAAYDRIAYRWQEQNANSVYGIIPLEKAISFCVHRGIALDIGCGSSGRFERVLSSRGFIVEGLDISPEMVRLARIRNPGITYYIADICDWIFPKAYDLISMWDSSFHLPLEQQAPVLKKVCAGLAPGGIILFTCGGGDVPRSISGVFYGIKFEYSTLGIEGYLSLLRESGCVCRHLEYDQYPEDHVYIIAQRIKQA